MENYLYMLQKNKLEHRIIELRKAKALLKTQLVEMVGVSYAQVARYETKDLQPPAQVLKKIAEALDTARFFTQRY